MSVETADPPPLLFATRSPSPPSFSPPHSPPPTSFAPLPNGFPHMAQPHTHNSDMQHDSADADVDMSMSITLPPPQGQNHDRDGRGAEDADGEAMDTSDDSAESPPAGQGLSGEEQRYFTREVREVQVPGNSDADAPAPSPLTPTAPTATTGAANPSEILPPPPPAGAVPPVVDIPPPPRSADATPPNARSRSHSPHSRIRRSGRARRDTSSSEDEDDGASHWHEIHEDTSAPSAEELKEIEAKGDEHSALDHTYWEGKAYAELSDPEYEPGPTGRIEWTLKGYNGTKENPNREIIMKSEIVSIGGYDWQIKFFPRGNDSDYLSVYIDCVTLAPKEAEEAGDHTGKPVKLAVPATDAASTADPSSFVIPLLSDQKVSLGKGVCAQIGVVLYNPTEPKVNVFRSWTHRHCTGYSDYGQTRFHGPYYEIPLRQRGQRAALLRNDTLAFTAYIRLVNDSTNCLGEHSDKQSNPWRSFDMTGIQSLAMTNRPRGMSGGNIIAAVATWLLLPPFREFLYEIQHLVPEPETALRTGPMPMAKALLKILYRLRAPQSASIPDVSASDVSQTVSLGDLYDAMMWYGIDTKMDQADVVQVIEIFRTKLEAELERTHLGNRALDPMFGPGKNHSTGLPAYRIPAEGSIQGPLAAHPGAVPGTPAVFTLEIQRQQFERDSRTWKKLASPVKLDEQITMNGAAYTLQSFVAHDESLQSGGYRTVVRHVTVTGEVQWFLFQDNRVLSETRMNANYRVERITQRLALVLAGSETVGTSQSVAYLVTYARQDALRRGPEPWDVPEWLVAEVAIDREIEAEFEDKDMLDSDHESGEENGTGNEIEGDVRDQATSQETSSRQEHEFELIDSRLFMQHEGPGIFDVFTRQSDMTKVKIPAETKFSELSKRLAPHLEGVTDHRQLRVRAMNSLTGTLYKPVLLREETQGGIDEPLTVAKFAERVGERRLWVHVLPKCEVPDEAPPKPAAVQPIQAPPAPRASTGNTGQAIAEEQENALHGSLPGSALAEPAEQDAVMSDAPEEANALADATNRPAQQSNSGTINPVTVIELPTLQLEVGTDGIVTGVQILPSSATSISIPPPPPPQMDIALPNGSAVVTGSAPPTTVRKGGLSPSEAIYFFLKVFDAENQRLIPKGSFIESKRARVDKTITKLLEASKSDGAADSSNSDGGYPQLFEEDDLLNARTLRRRKTFQQEDLMDACVIIAQWPLAEANTNALRARGLATTPEEYLQHLSYARNFPNLQHGTFTFDYFSSQYHRGEWLAGRPHGQGTRIGFDGSVYTGGFRLGKRHGAGSLTYPNGDVYDGGFAEGLREGQGTFRELDTGNAYEGGWRADKQFGQGVKRYVRAEFDERICRVCWSEDADAVFVDCGHVMMCLACARRVSVCPKCRAKVKWAIKFWLD